MRVDTSLALGPRPRSAGFPKESRLLKRRAFKNVYGVGRRLHGRRFVVFAAASATGGMRLGITATKKVGDAVVRNRLKRQVREIYRNWRAARENNPAGGLELVVNVTERAREAPFATLREELEGLLSRASGARP
jgi:ribonuclease P protein component